MAIDEVQCPMMSRAAQYGSIAIIILLQRYGADIQARDSVGEQAIHYATRCGQERALVWLLHAGADESAGNNFRCAYGITPLHLAIQNMNSGMEPRTVLSIMRVLLNAGAQVNAKDNVMTFTTPLQLVVHGAMSQDWRGPSGGPITCTPNGTKTNEVTPFITHAIYLLLEHKANLNERDKYNGNRTLLHQAIDDGNVSMATLLLDCGARTNIPDNGNESAMQAAIYVDSLTDRHFWRNLLESRSTSIPEPIPDPMTNMAGARFATNHTHPRHLSRLGMDDADAYPKGLFQNEFNSARPTMNHHTKSFY
jgi:ankyrin repeat protein